jgi:DNA-binding MarR family transcriptional regulator
MEQQRIELTEKEKASCRKGRKVQILILLDRTDRMTWSELRDAMGLKKNDFNLVTYTNRLINNGLIEKYDGSRFLPAEEVNYKYTYFSILDAGRELIADLRNKG